VNAHMCDGSNQTGWACASSMSSDSISIASVNQFCAQQGFGNGIGDTTIRATAADVPGPHCGEQTLHTSKPTQVVCATPTNFHQVGSGTDNSGTLHFNYAWDSSTGKLSDLNACTVGEIVNYPSGNPYSWPSPMSRSTTNPTVIDLAATSGSFGDDHEPPTSFTKPYSASSFTATQNYRYKCPCAASGNYVNMAGPNDIVRSVTQNTDGSWKYTVTKSGSSATINPLP